MAVKTIVSQEEIISAIQKMSFYEKSKEQKIEVVDGVYANVVMYGQTLHINMTAEGWWSRSMVSLRLDYSKFSSDEKPRLDSPSFNTSGGGIESEVTTDFGGYCDAMTRRGVAHLVLSMIAEQLVTDEYQEKICAAINEDYFKEKALYKKLQEKRDQERKEKEEQIKLKHDEWAANNSALNSSEAKEKIKEITKNNASKSDAELFVVNQKIKIESFCTHSGDIHEAFLEVSHDYGRNTWTLKPDGEHGGSERIPAKKVTEMMVDGVVSLVQ